MPHRKHSAAHKRDNYLVGRERSSFVIAQQTHKERCEPVIYYPNPQSLVITESEWSYSKESLQSDWHISRSCHYAAVECEGAAVVDHVAVEMRGKFKAKRASEPLSQSESFASVYRSPNHRQIWFTYVRAARSRIYSESTGISCLRDSFHI